MAPVAAVVANARICAPQQSSASRELDRALAPAFGTAVVRKARPEDVGPLIDLAESLIGGELASEAVVRRVVAWRADSLWAFLRDGRVVGGFAMLMLTPMGLKALLATTMDTRNPPTELLAESDEAPAAIYLWGTAHVSATDAMLKMLVRLQSPPYQMANLYAVPHTLSGSRFQQRWGFEPIPGHPRKLSQYIRLANRLH
jgi:hypothetical protein